MKLTFYREFFRHSTNTFENQFKKFYLEIPNAMVYLYTFMVLTSSNQNNFENLRIAKKVTLRFFFKDTISEYFLINNLKFLEKIVGNLFKNTISEVKIKMSLIFFEDLSQYDKFWMPLSRQNDYGQYRSRSNLAKFEYKEMGDSIKIQKDKILHGMLITIKEDLKVVRKGFKGKIQDSDAFWQMTAEFQNPPIVYFHFSFGLDLPLLENKQLFLVETYYYKNIRHTFLGLANMELKSKLEKLKGYQNTHGWLSYFILPYYPYMDWNTAQPPVRVIRKGVLNTFFNKNGFFDFVFRLGLVRFFPRKRMWNIFFLSFDKRWSILCISFLFLCLFFLILVMHSRMLFFVTDWVHTFRFKKSELFLDILILSSFFFFLLLYCKESFKRYTYKNR